MRETAHTVKHVLLAGFFCLVGLFIGTPVVLALTYLMRKVIW